MIRELLVVFLAFGDGAFILVMDPSVLVGVVQHARPRLRLSTAVLRYDTEDHAGRGALVRCSVDGEPAFC